MFARYIGIDYSGAAHDDKRLPGLQVYFARENELPTIKTTFSAPQGQHWNWSRKEIAQFLYAVLSEEVPTIVGIDHGFSFPEEYFIKYGLNSWEDFLKDFETTQRAGNPTWFRLTEKMDILCQKRISIWGTRTSGIIDPFRYFLAYDVAK